MGEDTWRNFQSLKFQDGFCISQRHASACLKKQDRNQSTPLCPSLYLTTSGDVCLQSYSAALVFNLSLAVLSSSLSSFFSFQLLHGNKHIIRGPLGRAQRIISHFFCLFASCDFFFFYFSVAVFTRPPLPTLPLCVSFFCCMQISFSLCLTVSCDDAATSDLPLDLGGIVLHVCLCVCSCVLVGLEHAYPLKHVWLFVYV